MKENKGISFIKQCMEILDNTSQEQFDRICAEKKLDEKFADLIYEDESFFLMFPETEKADSVYVGCSEDDYQINKLLVDWSRYDAEKWTYLNNNQWCNVIDERKFAQKIKLEINFENNIKIVSSESFKDSIKDAA